MSGFVVRCGTSTGSFQGPVADELEALHRHLAVARRAVDHIEREQRNSAKRTNGGARKRTTATSPTRSITP